MEQTQPLIRAYRPEDLPALCEIWNEVVEDGVAFPQTSPLTLAEAEAYFARQSFCAVAERDGVVEGLYILHPNNEGRCGHIANASYAVASRFRGRRTGEALVRHSLQKGGELGFRLLQFNAVVKSNLPAQRLYEQLGFVRLGEIPGGFLLKNGRYEDIILMYHTL